MPTFPNFSLFLTEAHKFAALQAKKEPLTDEERQKVMDAKAVWHRSNHQGKPSAAVWKSRDSKGNPIYVTHTHRAFAAEKTLGAAIRKFHSEIKDTA